jgi:hypothetical protein
VAASSAGAASGYTLAYAMIGGLGVVLFGAALLLKSRHDEARPAEAGSRPSSGEQDSARA